MTARAPVLSNQEYAGVGDQLSHSFVADPRATIDTRKFPYHLDRTGARPIAAKVNKAITTLVSAWGGGVIILGEGDFNWDAQFTAESRIKIRGQGPGLTRLAKGNHSGFVCVDVEDCELSGVTIDASAGGNSVRMGNCLHLTVRDVVFLNPISNTVEGLGQIQGLLLDHLTFEGAGGASMIDIHNKTYGTPSTSFANTIRTVRFPDFENATPGGVTCVSLRGWGWNVDGVNAEGIFLTGDKVLECRSGDADDTHGWGAKQSFVSNIWGRQTDDTKLGACVVVTNAYCIVNTVYAEGLQYGFVASGALSSSAESGSATGIVAVGCQYGINISSAPDFVVTASVLDGCDYGVYNAGEGTIYQAIKTKNSTIAGYTDASVNGGLFVGCGSANDNVAMVDNGSSTQVRDCPDFGPLDLGEVSSGSVTIEPCRRDRYTLINEGNFEILPGSVSVGRTVLIVVNGAAPGDIDVSGFDVSSGSFDDIPTHAHQCTIDVNEEGSVIAIVPLNVTFDGGDANYPTLFKMCQEMTLADAAAPTIGGSLTIGGKAMGAAYGYCIKDGDQNVTSFTEGDWFTATADSEVAIVVVKGTLTIASGQVFKPAHRKLALVIYAEAVVVNGEISMTARGANHSASGSNIPAVDIRIINGTHGGVANPKVPASGGAGAPSTVITNPGAAINSGGAFGTDGTNGQTGGGGAGSARANAGGSFTVTGGAGSQGTSFCGGIGGGGTASSSASTGVAGAASGGAGGAAGVGNSGGGAGNPGGAHSLAGADGTAGAGGTVIIFCVGAYSGSGVVTANGANGGGTNGSGTGCGGGASGGGHVTILYGSDAGPVPTATGGVGGQGTVANRSGGDGGDGTARKLALAA